MTKLTQKEAVFQAVCQVTGHKGEGVVSITKEQRGQVTNILFESFKAGAIELDREYSDAELRAYISGLQSNWLRKDTRMNGGVQYKAKNPGSRAGSTDPQIKAMKALISTLDSDSDKAEVQAHIDERMKVLNAEKQAKTVDFSALPSDLAAKFGK